MSYESSSTTIDTERPAFSDRRLEREALLRYALVVRSSKEAVGERCFPDSSTRLRIRKTPRSDLLLIKRLLAVLSEQFQIVAEQPLS